MGYRIFKKEGDRLSYCSECKKEITQGIIKTYRCEFGGFQEIDYCLKCALPVLKDEIMSLVKLMRTTIEMRKQELKEE